MKDKGNEFDMDEKMKELAEKENISFLKTLLKFKNKDTSIKTSSPKEVSKYHTINEKSIEPKNSDIKEEKKSICNSFGFIIFILKSSITLYLTQLDNDRFLRFHYELRKKLTYLLIFH